MHHRVMDIEFVEKNILDATFQDGVIKRYNVSAMFEKFPEMKQLENWDFFCSGHIMGFYGIAWNDELDLDAETVYQDGITVGRVDMPIREMVGAAVNEARNDVGLTQKQLGKLAGVDQSDISKLEVGQSNPSVVMLDRIAKAM